MEPSYVFLKITFPEDLSTNYRTFKFHKNFSVNHVIRELDNLVREWAEEQSRKDPNNNNNKNYANYFKNPKLKSSDWRTPSSCTSSATQFSALSFDESAIMEKESYISADALYVSHFGLYVPEFHLWLRESAKLKDYPNLDTVEFVEYKPKDRDMALNGHDTVSKSRSKSFRHFTNPIRKKLFWSPEHLWNGCHRFPNTKKTRNPFNTFAYNPPNHNGLAHGLLVDNPLFSDLVITFPTAPTIKPIPAHFVVLLTRCPSFLPKRDVKLEQVDVTHPMLTDRATMIRFLMYIYGGDPKFSTCSAEIVMRLYMAGSVYNIPRLMQKSLQFLPKRLTVDTVVPCIRLAEKMHSAELTDCCVQYCVDNYSSFVLDKERTKSLGIEVFQHIVALRANRNDLDTVQESPKDCPRGTLVADYKRLYDSQYMADMEVIVGHQKFECHKAILAIHSNYLAKLCLEAIQNYQKKGLRSMSTRKLKKRADLPCIEITDVTPQVFEAILKFIYYCDTTFTTGVACDILKVCKRFELHTLQSYCEDYLENSSVSHETAFTMYSLHSWYSGSYFQQQFADRMKTKATRFMVKNFTSLDLRQVLQLHPHDAMEVLQMIQKLNNNNKQEIVKSQNFQALKDVSESECSVQSKHKLKRWQFKHIDSDVTDAESVSGRSDMTIPSESILQHGPEIVYPSYYPFQKQFDSVKANQVVLPQGKKDKKKKPVSVFDVDFRQNEANPTTDPIPDSRDSTSHAPEDDVRIPESTTSSDLSVNLNDTHSRVAPSEYHMFKPIARIESRDKDELVSAAMNQIENLIDSLSSIISEVQSANNSSY